MKNAKTFTVKPSNVLSSFQLIHQSQEFKMVFGIVSTRDIVVATYMSILVELTPSSAYIAMNMSLYLKVNHVSCIQINVSMNTSAQDP